MSTADIIRHAALHVTPTDDPRIFATWVRGQPKAWSILYDLLHPSPAWYQRQSMNVRRMALLFVAEALESEA
jgi:hypothetical protein